MKILVFMVKISIYHKLCTKIWKEEKWPSEWTKAVFVPIPKKGDLQQCTNYMTIALISHASKILLKIIKKRLQRKLDEEINQTQAGSWHEGPNFQPTNANRKMSRSQYKLAYVFYRLLKSLRLRWTSRNDRSIEEDELPLQDHKLNN